MFFSSHHGKKQYFVKILVSKTPQNDREMNEANNSNKKKTTMQIRHKNY